MSKTLENAALQRLIHEPGLFAQCDLTIEDFETGPNRIIFETIASLSRSGMDFGSVEVIDAGTKKHGQDFIRWVESALADGCSHLHGDCFETLRRQGEDRRARKAIVGRLDGISRMNSAEIYDVLQEVARSIETGTRKAATPATMVVKPDELRGWLTGAKPAKRKSVVRTEDDKDYLIRGKTGLLVSPGGRGKTGLLVQLALAVATGTDWIGYQTTKGKVLLVLGEEDREEMKLRLFDAYAAQRDDEKMSLDDLAQNLVAMPIYAENPRFLKPVDRYERGSSADESPFYHRLVRYLEDNGPWALVVIDPLSRFMGEEENDSAAATRFVELLERLTQAPGKPAVIVAHHANKASLNEDTDQGAARGSSALVDGVRWVANLDLANPKSPSADEREVRKLKVVKTKYTALHPDKLMRYMGGLWKAEGATTAMSAKKAAFERDFGGSNER